MDRIKPYIGRIKPYIYGIRPHLSRMAIYCAICAVGYLTIAVAGDLWVQRWLAVF